MISSPSSKCKHSQSSMSSSLRTSTPVRAIPSTLATRSSPSIPPPGQLYDPTLRAVLRYRLIYNIFLCSALLSWVHAVGWSIWHKGGVYPLGLTGFLVTPFLPVTLASAIVTWVFVALPAVVLKKVYLTSACHSLSLL
jgi:nucleoporin NDC1